MKTTIKPDRMDELEIKSHKRKLRMARYRRTLNRLAKEFDKTLLGDMADGLSRELKRMY